MAFVTYGQLLFAEQLGSGNGRFVDVRLRAIVERALELKADALAIGHNHPSGDPTPSALDFAATRRLKELCFALDIELIDHLIYSNNLVHSMKLGRTMCLTRG